MLEADHQVVGIPDQPNLIRNPTTLEQRISNPLVIL
jgi:hypothetical protein